MKNPFRRWIANLKKTVSVEGRSNTVGVTSRLGVYPAAPSQKVGLDAKEGTGAYFMSSDAAPALDTSISPTWTGSHDFTKTSIAVKTQAKGDNSTSAASTAFVQDAVDAAWPSGSFRVEYWFGNTQLRICTYKTGEFPPIPRVDDLVALDRLYSVSYLVYNLYKAPTTPEVSVFVKPYG